MEGIVYDEQLVEGVGGGGAGGKNTRMETLESAKEGVFLLR